MNASSEPTDDELIDRHRASAESDLRCFDLLVERYQDRVVTNCRYITRSPSDAEDLAQEVFVKAFFGLDGFERRASFRTWLQKIKVNHCVNFLKKHAGRSHVSLDDPDLEGSEIHTASGAERSVRRIQDQQHISLVLDSMADTLRVPLLLRDMDGFSYQEIAEMLDLGLSAVKMRIKRARGEFRERFAAGPAAAETSEPGPS